MSNIQEEISGSVWTPCTMECGDNIVYSKRDLIWDYLPAFESMMQTGELCDVNFKAEDVSISAHRVVLAAGIPYFRQVFKTTAVQMKSEEIVMTQVEPKALRSLINFAYSGKIEISIETVRSIFSASAFLQLTEIHEVCSEFLLQRLCVENVLEVRNFAEESGCGSLVKQTDRFMREKFLELSATEEFLTMPFFSLKELVDDDDLQVSKEEEVFEAVMKWIKADSERHPLLPELLRSIRMRHLSPLYLYEKVENDEIIRTSLPCRDLLDEIKCYFLLPEKRPLFRIFPTNPRNQTNKLYAVCASESAGCSVISYDSKSEKWTLLAKNAMHDHLLDILVSHEKVYFFGGKIFGSFHLKTLEWSTMEPIHDHVCGAGVVLHFDNIYIFGNSSRDLSRKVRCFDTLGSRWLMEGSMLTQRSRPRVVSMGESIFVLGGYPDGMYWNSAVHNSVEKYNPQTGTSSFLPPMLTSRYWFGVSALKGKIYVCGGCDGNRVPSNSVEVFDPMSNEWSFVSPMSVPRHSLSLVSYNNKLFAVGGKTTFGKTVRRVEIYDPESNLWTNGAPLDVSYKAATVRAQSSWCLQQVERDIQ